MINQEDIKLKETKRPLAITIICILGFIGVSFSIPLIFSVTALQIGSWYPPYLGFSLVIGTSCLIGFWYMKKLAVYSYIVFVVVNQIVLLTLDVWNIMAILFPAIIIGIALNHINKMN